MLIKNSNESQCELILRYLKKGRSITGLEALSKFKCIRLASRISEMIKSGISIQSRFIRLPSGKRIKVYWID